MTSDNCSENNLVYPFTARNTGNNSSYGIPEMLQNFSNKEYSITSLLNTCDKFSIGENVKIVSVNPTPHIGAEHLVYFELIN